MNIGYSEVALSEEIIELISLSFSLTSDSALGEWLSFDEMRGVINREQGVCIGATDEFGTLVSMIYAQQENPVNGKEGAEKWVIIVEAIHPKQKNKGIGSNLLRAIEDCVRKNGGKKMFVFTNEGDERVINFYKKNNYKDAGHIRDY